MTDATAERTEETRAERLTLLFALGIMVAPFLAALMLAAIILRENAQGLAQIEEKVMMIDATAAAGRIVHQLQRERGRSSGYIGSNQRAFPEQLRQQRALTDAAIAAAEVDFAAIDFARLDRTLVSNEVFDRQMLSDTVGRARGALARLGEIRRKVDTLAIERQAMMDYYSGIIASLMEISELSAIWAFDTMGERIGNASAMLQEGIERAGLERAAGASGFGARAMDPQTLLTMTRLQAAQNVLFSQFSKMASDSHAARLSDVLDSPAALRLDELRAIARDPDPARQAEVTAEEWFAASTAVIDALASLSTELNAAQIADISMTRADLVGANRQTAWVLGAAILLSLLAAVWQSRSFVHPIRTLASALNRLGRGDGKIQVLGAERRDLVGLLARSVARMVEINTSRFHDVLYHAPIATSIEDLNGGHVRHNPAMARFLGAEETALARRTLQDFMSKRDRAQFEAERASLPDRDTLVSEHEMTFHRSDGTEARGLTTRCFVRGTGGAPDFVITQVQDISEIKRVEALTANFVSTISHELRTPLTAVLAAIGLLHGKKTARTDAGEKRLLDIARNNCNRLLVLINDLLDMERLSQGGVRLEMDRHDIAELAAATLDELAPYARGMEQRLSPLICTRSYYAWTDAIRFSQILSNLITNAAKFSPRDSEIRVSVDAVDDMIRVSVIDEGPGIDPAFERDLFGAFTQADSSASRAQGGSGVGLHLSKGLVTQLGGTIGFFNNAVKGATFWFTVPAMGVQSLGPPAPTALAAPSGDLPRILHVEDNPGVCELLARVLDGRARVHSVQTFADAKEALAGDPFDLILIDWDLPDGSGMDLLLDPAISGSSAPVISLSANSEFIRPARTELNIRKAEVPLEEVGEILMRVLERRADALRELAPRRGT